MNYIKEYPDYVYYNQIQKNMDGYHNFLDEVEEEAKNTQTEHGSIGFDDEQKHDISIRNCSVKWLHSFNLRQKINDLFWLTNIENFGINIQSAMEMQYTVYNGNNNNGEYYHWHADSGLLNRGSYVRKLTWITLLTDSSEFEGGKLQIQSDDLTNPETKHETFLHHTIPEERFSKAGDTIIFPSIKRHRVTPVTSGIRKTLVSWCYGPEWA